jgi:hypothetical protein
MMGFPPRDEVVAFGVALNEMYGAADRPAFCNGYPFGNGVHVPLCVDGEGLLVWLSEYLRLRVNGYTHADAQLDVFAQIADVWDPANAPHPRPAAPVPADPVKPTDPIKPPTADVPGMLDNMCRFAAFYKARCARLGWWPNQPDDHENQMQFLRQTILEYRAATGDKSFVMKRASATRPVSNEVIVFMVDEHTGDYRRYWDFIGDAGLRSFDIKDTPQKLGHGAILPKDQPLVDPVTLNTIVG